jgi:fructose-specific phosphotransferase system IIA component
MEKSELLNYFQEPLFISSLSATTRDAALDELVLRFVETKIVRNRNIVSEMLRRREALGSTGIGHGIAIPHGRSTAIPDVIIAFGRSDKGIDWEAIDGKPVHLIFLVLAPPQEQNNRYLPILGGLVEMLNDGKQREKLRKIKSFSDLTSLLLS